MGIPTEKVAETPTQESIQNTRHSKRPLVNSLLVRSSVLLIGLTALACGTKSEQISPVDITNALTNPQGTSEGYTPPPPSALPSEDLKHHDDIWVAAREILNRDYFTNGGISMLDSVRFDPRTNMTLAILAHKHNYYSNQLGVNEQPFLVRNFYAEDGQLLQSYIAPSGGMLPLIDYNLIPGGGFEPDFERSPDNLITLASRMFNVETGEYTSYKRSFAEGRIITQFTQSETLDSKGRTVKVFISNTQEVTDPQYQYLLQNPPAIEVGIFYTPVS